VQNEELAVTRERNRLAREIHDTLGHYLTVVNIQLEAARAVQSTDPVRLADALNTAQGLAQKGLRDIRLSVATLRAPTPDDQPLTETLRQLVSQGDTSGLAVEMEVLGEPRPISPQARLSLYRAGQEGLTNVRKHARVASAQLVLDFRSVAKVSLSVTDHGVGAPNGAATSGSFGLLGLRERAQLLGGTVRVETAPGAGFTMMMEVPE
jgi:signal transduction histidine kinase